MFSSIPILYPLDTSGILELGQPESLNTAKYPWQ